jgi:beta-lactamase class A
LTLVPTLARAAEEAPPAVAQDIAGLGQIDEPLQARIAALANEAGLTRIGFAAADITKGRAAFVRGGELFPLQSVYKFPLAVALLHMVQSRQLQFERAVTLTRAQIAPGVSRLADTLRRGPMHINARRLFDAMLVNSDNTAADALMKLAGGPERIQNKLKELDIDGLRVDRLERDLQVEALGVTPPIDFAKADALGRALDELDALEQRKALDRYLKDPRDTGNARGLVKLLVRLTDGRMIQPRYATMLLDLMKRTKTGNDRLRSGFPQGWTVSHRSGTSATVLGVTAAHNDVALAIGPKGQRIALALLISGATDSAANLALFHKATARAVYEAWS